MEDSVDVTRKRFECVLVIWSWRFCLRCVVTDNSFFPSKALCPSGAAKCIAVVLKYGSVNLGYRTRGHSSDKQAKT